MSIIKYSSLATGVQTNNKLKLTAGLDQIGLASGTKPLPGDQQGLHKSNQAGPALAGPPVRAGDQAAKSQDLRGVCWAKLTGYGGDTQGLTEGDPGGVTDDLPS